jgi:hypothetical protein
MAKVKDVFPYTPTVHIDTEWAKHRTLADMWAKYDEETDSMLIYVTGKPVPGVNVYLGNDIYAIVDSHDGNKMIGLYLEGWEEFSTKLDLVNRSWHEIREQAAQGADETLALRLLALVLVMTLGQEDPLLPQLA